MLSVLLALSTPSSAAVPMDPSAVAEFRTDPRPNRVYGTPVVFSEPGTTNTWVAYTDKFPTSFPPRNLYLYQWLNGVAGRTASLLTDDDANAPLAAPNGGVTMSSFLYWQGTQLTLGSWSTWGSLSTTNLDPVTGLASSPQVSAANNLSVTGADMGGFLDTSATDPVLFAGNFCLIGQDCDTANGMGDLMAFDIPAVLGGATPAEHPFEAWATGTNGLRNDFGDGTEVLMAHGTCISQCTGGNCYSTPYNDDHDCDLHTVSWDGSALTLVDQLDQGQTGTCGTYEPGNCVVEPTPLDLPGPQGGQQVVALRTHGEVEIVRVTAQGGLLRQCTVDWQGPGVEHPIEHAVTVGEQPDTGAQQLFHVVRSAGSTEVVTWEVSDFVNPYTGQCKLSACSGDPTTCAQLPADHSIATLDGMVWGPGATVRYVDETTETPTDRLAYIVVEGAKTTVAPTNPAEPEIGDRGLCKTGERPPRVHVFVDQGGTWLDLVAPLGQVCWEYDQNYVSPSQPDAWESIQSIAGVAVEDSRIYVQTTDGTAWEIDTALADVGGYVDGYLGAWPRFKHDNYGTGRMY